MEEGTHNQGYSYEGKSPALNLPAITSLLTVTNPVSTAAVFPVLTARNAGPTEKNMNTAMRSSSVQAVNGQNVDTVAKNVKNVWNLPEAY
jgi:hypothetical protein